MGTAWEIITDGSMTPDRKTQERCSVKTTLAGTTLNRKDTSSTGRSIRHGGNTWHGRAHEMNTNIKCPRIDHVSFDKSDVSTMCRSIKVTFRSSDALFSKSDVSIMSFDKSDILI